MAAAPREEQQRRRPPETFLIFLLVYFILARRFYLVFSKGIWGTGFCFLPWGRLRSSERVSAQAEREL